MPLGKSHRAPQRQQHRPDQRDPAGHPMRELNDGRYLWRMRHHFAVAQRPVAPTTGARSARTNIRAPQRDDQVPGQHRPGEAREALRVLLHRRCRRNCHWCHCIKTTPASPPSIFVKIVSLTVMYWLRVSLLASVLLALITETLPAQKKKKTTDDAGYVPIILPENNKKKTKDENTQTLPPPRELPSAVFAETDRLTFEVTPLSSKGLLSAQTRDTLRNLLRTSKGTIVKLRAFVAGSGDLRRVGELVGETFAEKHAPLPALSVAQVGALPLEGAQIVIEATEVDKKVVNPNGVAFLSGQSAPSVMQSLEKL